MTEILCRWLNDELRVSQQVDDTNFAEACANGFLIGEVLKKHQLQNDFEFFSQNKTSDSKLNNFTRLEPTFRLLEVPFDTNVARDVMTQKAGVATRLMYQLYIALQNKEAANLTGVAMETMRPRAPVKLESMERVPYGERLKILTPRQSDINLDQLVDKFRERKRSHLDVEFRTKYEEEERRRQWQQEQRMFELQKAAQARQRQTELVARIKAATVEIPKPPPNRTLRAIAVRKELARKKEAENTSKEIAAFEQQISRNVPVGVETQDERDVDEEVAAYLQQPEKTQAELASLIKPASNDDYIGKIRKRLEEDAVARQEREKRRRKVLVDQIKAHEANEEMRREEFLVTRLMRQSQQERRIATQLLQLRHEKAVIQQNRIFRQEQYEERRQKDFQEALDKEAEMARQAKLEYIEQTQRDKELHDKIAQERAEAKYQKHYNLCKDILMDIVDFSCKVGKYRELTNRLLPPKLMREWTLLFTTGQPLYELAEEEEFIEPEVPTEEQLMEEERQKLVDEGDFMEYKNMVGEWQPPEDSEIKGIPSNNAILGHILARLFNIVSPPSPPPAPPDIPPFPVKACFLGKAFCGKTTLAEYMAQEHGLKVLNVDALVQEAVDAYKGGEILEMPEAPTETITDVAEGELQTDAQTGVNISTTVTPAPPGSVVDAKSVASAKTGVTAEVPPSRETTTTAPPDDGKEKGDEEKPEAPKEEGAGETKEGETAESKEPKSAKKKKKDKPELSARGKLGQKAIKLLRKGQPLKDELLVEIMVEAVRRAKEEQGWIMDGFPSTVAQAKLLEKALSGYDANAKPSKHKLRQSRLALDPNPPKDPPPPVSGIDLVVHLDVTDDLAMRRAAGRYYANQEEEEYHQEFKPPPEGSASGVGKQEKVQPVKDPAFDQEQIQHRITGFQDSWKKLDKWFSSFHILQKLDICMEKEEACQAVKNLMVETKEKMEKAKEDALRAEEEASKTAEEAPPTTADTSSAVPTDGMESTAPQQPDPQTTTSETDKGAASPGGSRAGSAKGKGSARGRSPKGEKGKRSSSKGSRSGSAKKSPSKDAKKSAKEDKKKGASPKRKGSRSKSPKKRRTPTPEPEPEPEPPAEPTGPPPPQPGSDDWVYVDEPIDENLANALAPHWENTESTYLGASKHVFRNIRHEREDIYHYYYRIRRNFEAYLRRPDSKQEFMNMWQQEYNQIAEDMRDDDETKAELHQRVQDLKEQLWEMSDERKLEAEAERQSVINEGWLEDRLGLLTNHYLTLMQCEVDRYQDTLRLLKDYYQGMEGKIPEELDPNYARIPLIDLPPMERPDSGIPPAESAVPSESHTQLVTPTPTTPSAKGKKGKGEPVEEIKEVEDEVKPKIPLVPRRPGSSEGFFPIPTPGADKREAKGTKSRAGKGKEKEKAAAPSTSADEEKDTPQPPADPDERLIFEAYQFGLHKISEMTVAEMAAKDAEEEADKAREAERAEKAEKKGKGKDKDKGGKRAKSKSPSGKKTPGGKKSPKKGKKTATPTPPPTPPPVEDTPEEKAKRELKDRMKAEYVGAIGHEESSLKTRMELIKVHAIQVLQELKAKAEEAYKDMDNWLGARFIQEMDSINVVCQYLGECIEERAKIQPELVVFQDDFAINKLVKVYRTPSPPPRPDPIELAQADAFAVEQIINLQAQFIKSAPSGFISAKGFIDTLCDLTALTHGMEALPDGWMNISIAQLETLAVQLSPDSEYIDWKTFLLQSCQPWLQPSQAQLLETLEEFKKADVLNSGTVTREQFEQVPLWYSYEQRAVSPEDPTEPRPYNRTLYIQRLFFDIFADNNAIPPVLDYTNMLLYFSIDANYLNGFFRALSVASGKHMPRPKPVEVEPTKRDIETMKEMQQTIVNQHGKVVETLTGEDLILGPRHIEPSLGPPEEGVPVSAVTATVPLSALVRVLHHGQPSLGDSHRFSVTSDPEDTFSQERLAAVYRELGSEELEPVPFYTLIQHPIIQDCLSLCHRYKAPDFSSVFTAPAVLPSDNDAQSIMS
ncbi:sperm flagellar protein 2-like isoform X2 [Lytechinus variegatus]|uniref:sperm flagellar protein 2-like isoform X2 n=1 Tax=Lytechinus variegatus TaxID=7654 RepID=UPI001BB14C02|nr:sperm flagellar protein 2-like isoform X2 [Lytechinus variegatus]